MVRREPFRLFFPLALAVAIAGVLPWLLFGRGLVRSWPGTFHSLTMGQGFFVAAAVGFLGTMIPRRTGAEPMSWPELAILALGTAAAPVLLAHGSLASAQVAYLIVLAVLVQFVVRRSRQGAARRPPPPSFVLIPLALLAGLGGGALLVASTLGADVWTLVLGRMLVLQGLPLGLVLALASFAVELWLSERAGLLLRAGVCAAELIAGPVWSRAGRPGLHRSLFRVALFFVPLGLAAAGVAPERRVPSLHVTYIAGLALLVLSVTVHVTLYHTGREAKADRWPWPVVLASAFLFAAVAVRAVAERAFDDYFVALTLASSLWLASALVWAAYLVVMVVRTRAVQP
jgi:uncharacterized protein involved in response to NO